MLGAFGIRLDGAHRCKMTATSPVGISHDGCENIYELSQLNGCPWAIEIQEPCLYTVSCSCEHIQVDAEAERKRLGD